jgi:acetyl esterase/lipase
VVRESIGLRELPFFIGIGRDDFTLPSALRFGEALKQAGVKTVRCREYPDVEHLIIVQAALPDVFAFFDEIAKRPRSPAP